MSDNQEKILNSLKADYEEIRIPENIDDFIKSGMVKYHKKNKVFQAARFASVAAVIALLVFSATIRFSPVFADYLSEVPVLKYIVSLVNYDKGLKAAVENNFIQNVTLSDEHEGIKFTVDNIIIDNARMIVFYTIENNSQYKNLHMSSVRFTDEAGKDLEAGHSYSSFYNSSEQNLIQDNIKVSFVESTIIPENIHLAVELRQSDNADSEGNSKLPYTWQVNIPIDKNKFASLKEIYPINQTIEIEGQKVNVEKAIMYPTRIEVQMQLPEENTKKILHFDNLKILDENGEAFATISNDVSATIANDDHIKLYFESNYFSKPKELYLQVNSVKALDKDKLEVIVDTDKKQLLKSPDNKLQLQDIISTNEGTNLHFLLDTDDILDNNITYFVFDSQIKDQNNIETSVVLASSEAPDNQHNQNITVTIPDNAKFTNPLKLTIEDYPTRIKCDNKIRIK